MADIWLAAGKRTPFARAGGALAGKDALQLSVPVVKAMFADAGRPDLAVWGAVIPNLAWSNLAREVLLEAGSDPTIPAFSTVMACSTSMAGAFQAAGMLDDRGRSLALVGGAESMSRVQVGLTQNLSDDLRRVMEARRFGDRLRAIGRIQASDIRLHVPKIQNRITGKSMGEHTEEMAKGWAITRAEQDEIALASHQKAAAAWKAGFFDDLVLRMAETGHDTTVREDTSLEKLAKLPPSFDRRGSRGCQRPRRACGWSTTRSTPSTCSASTS
jgi:acetyl-CoA C-acetyltransferase